MYEGGWDDEGWMDDERWDRFRNDPRKQPAGFVAQETKPAVTTPVKTATESSSALALIKPSIAKPLVRYEDRIVVYAFEEGSEKPVVLAAPLAAAFAPVWNKLEELFGVVDVKAEDHQLDGVPDLECCIPVPLEYYREKSVVKGRPFVPQTCVLQSTSDYMEHMLGMKLHYSDRKFFVNHPDTDPGGVSLPYTAKVVQQLIEPYGLRVTRIRCHASEFTPRGDLADWMRYLGCNPLGAQDFRTSNEEFAKIAGAPLADVNKLFAFEFHTEPFRPSVVCEASKATTLSAPQGHASYLAPRSGVTSWWLSLQLGRDEWVHPTKPSYPTEYPDESVVEPDLPEILRAAKAANSDEQAFRERVARGEVRQ